ncbi:hypothetical protein BKA56DRAFT_626066 [Ilyonectria sp. MPI-CAGE-AT-0026]|nr:hypothetical protein BKA56DRAFT_626066 [Ilyonectria sp. MPI-CAGE-AT-0026]
MAKVCQVRPGYLWLLRRLRARAPTSLPSALGPDQIIQQAPAAAIINSVIPASTTTVIAAEQPVETKPAEATAVETKAVEEKPAEAPAEASTKPKKTPTEIPGGFPVTPTNQPDKPIGINPLPEECF